MTTKNKQPTDREIQLWALEQKVAFEQGRLSAGQIRECRKVGLPFDVLTGREVAAVIRHNKLRTAKLYKQFRERCHWLHLPTWQFVMKNVPKHGWEWTVPFTVRKHLTGRGK